MDAVKAQLTTTMSDDSSRTSKLTCSVPRDESAAGFGPLGPAYKIRPTAKPRKRVAIAVPIAPSPTMPVHRVLAQAAMKTAPAAAVTPPHGLTNCGSLELSATQPHRMPVPPLAGAHRGLPLGDTAGGGKHERESMVGGGVG